MRRPGLILDAGELVVGVVVTVICTATGHPPSVVSWVTGAVGMAAAFAGRLVFKGQRDMTPEAQVLLLVLLIAVLGLATAGSKDPTLAVLFAAFGAAGLLTRLWQERAAARRTRVHAQQEAPRRAP